MRKKEIVFNKRDFFAEIVIEFRLWIRTSRALSSNETENQLDQKTKDENDANQIYIHEWFKIRIWD